MCLRFIDKLIIALIFIFSFIGETYANSITEYTGKELFKQQEQAYTDYYINDGKVQHITNTHKVEYLVEPEETYDNNEIINKAVEFIKKYEGFTHYPYFDYHGYSIGYGLNAKGRNYITRKQADIELREKVVSILNQIDNKYGLKHIEPETKITLISFTYNLGWKTYVLELAKKNDKEVLAKEIIKYNKAKGNVLSGLVKRRKGEIALMNEYNVQSTQYVLD